MLLNLVDDIIDIAKIEAGELKIVKKDCDLNALGEELLTTSSEILKKFNKQHLSTQFQTRSGCRKSISENRPVKTQAGIDKPGQQCHQVYR